MSKLDYDKENIIKSYLNGEGLKTLAKKYECDKKTVRKLLIENGIVIKALNHKPYPIDETFFDKSDTPDKAYILGLWYVDGCNTNQNKIHITLQEQDKELLEKVKKVMKYDKPLSFYNRSNKNPKLQNTYTLVIYNKHMSESLKDKGCVERKSLVLQFPDWMPENLMSHFLRGYFDGDGHIGKNGRGAHASIISSCYFIQSLYDYLIKIGIECHIYKTQEKTWTISTTKKLETKKLMDYLYKDAKLYMERKYQIYLEKFYK